MINSPVPARSRTRIFRFIAVHRTPASVPHLFDSSRHMRLEPYSNVWVKYDDDDDDLVDLTSLPQSVVRRYGSLADAINAIAGGLDENCSISGGASAGYLGLLRAKG